MSNERILYGPFEQVITMEGLPLKGGLSDKQLPIIEQGGVLVSNGIILKTGSYSQLHTSHPEASLERPAEPSILMPGLIDCHTHLCFAGKRSIDYAKKLSGKTYLDIAREGGGILQTVGYTREADPDILLAGLKERINRHRSQGVTTMEVKSGYGLSREQELKMLQVIAAAKNESDADIIPTCLAAHTIPPEFSGRPVEYLDYILNDLLPVVAERKLADRIDIFVEETAFGIKEARDYLSKAKTLGFDITIHANQFSAGGVELAVNMGALSADHLEVLNEDEMGMLAKSDTVGVVLPGASLGLGIPFAPARKMLQAGCCVAIASDWNPGSAPMGDLWVQASLLAVYEKLNFSEIMAGLTFRAAKALKLSDRGILAPGCRADMISFATNDYRDILYYQGSMKPNAVWT